MCNISSWRRYFSILHLGKVGRRTRLLRGETGAVGRGRSCCQLRRMVDPPEEMSYEQSVACRVTVPLRFKSGTNPAEPNRQGIQNLGPVAAVVDRGLLVLMVLLRFYYVLQIWPGRRRKISW